ncbi:Chromo domain-containing 2-like protein [Cladobotryum mycophilum]|uniref:Chromo domain-containing 2-like protein n=1 Tax=Cladobotryum mycophilum TaxID=491253 RepID=A0ABR0STD7_9HYPO
MPRGRKRGTKIKAALSDDEASDFESPLPAKLRGSTSEDVPVKSVKLSNGADANEDEEGDEEEEGDEDGDEDLGEDEFIVEAIKKHMIDEDGTLKFQVKWEGWDKKSDLTWEPEENLKESASEILAAYLTSVGGRDSIFEESQEAARGKKRGRTSSTTPAAAPKRSRKNGVHPSDSTPPVSNKSWSPPAGSWEDEIESIDACEDEGSGRLVVYLVWKNGRKTKHDTSVIYKKCPQKMLLFYERHVRIIREENKAQNE